MDHQNQISCLGLIVFFFMVIAFFFFYTKINVCSTYRFIVYKVYLILCDFDWKAMLKSLPAGAGIVGTGVCRFTLRWLSDVCDPNDIKVDSGERYVFEVPRTDGSVAHLDSYKNVSTQIAMHSVLGSMILGKPEWNFIVQTMWSM